MNIVRSSIVRAWLLCTLALVPSALAAPAAQAPAEGSPRATAPAGPRGRSMNEMLAEADSALRARGGARAEHAQLYLSWNAPYGMSRASSQRVPTCGDTTAVDTLYLSFLPGRTTDSFTGFSAELRFHATGGDTLGPFWHMEGKGGANPGNLQVEFGPSETIPGVQPWTVAGQGLAFLDHTPDAMRLRTIFAVALEKRSHVDSARVYTLCRILVRHRRTATLAGCEQPVCVEWVIGRFGFALKDEPEVRRGERFVVWGRDATACDASRGPRAPVWRPGALRPR